MTWFHLPARRVDEPLGTVEPLRDFDVLVAQRATEGGAERSWRRCGAEVVNEAADGPRGPIPAPGIEAHARREKVAKVDVVFVSGQAPHGTLEGPSLALVADKADFGSSRVQRWFGRTWR